MPVLPLSCAVNLTVSGALLRSHRHALPLQLLCLLCYTIGSTLLCDRELSGFLCLSQVIIRRTSSSRLCISACLALGSSIRQVSETRPLSWRHLPRSDRAKYATERRAPFAASCLCCRSCIACSAVLSCECCFCWYCLAIRTLNDRYLPLWPSVPSRDPEGARAIFASGRGDRSHPIGVPACFRLLVVLCGQPSAQDGFVPSYGASGAPAHEGGSGNDFGCGLLSHDPSIRYTLGPDAAHSGDCAGRAQDPCPSRCFEGRGIRPRRKPRQQN